MLIISQRHVYKIAFNFRTGRKQFKTRAIKMSCDSNGIKL